MATQKFVPILSILALAGSREATQEAAFTGLEFGIAQYLRHGNANPLQDTITGLQSCKGSNAKRVAAMIGEAHAAVLTQWAEFKRTRTPEAVDAAIAVIVRACIASYDAASEAADTARAEKAAANKIEKAKAERKAAAEARATAVKPQPLTVAVAAAFLRAALAAGDADADAALIALMEEFTELAATETAAA